MTWSSTLRTEMPTTSGENVSTAWLIAAAGFVSASRSTKAVSYPACRSAAATNDSPKGSTGMLIRSVLADSNSTFMVVLYRP